MCELYAGDYEDTAVWQEKEQAARKAYPCWICKGEIKPGQRYRRLFYVGERGGKGQTSFSCMDCALLQDGFENAHDIVLSYEYFEEHLVECVREAEPGVEVWRMALADLKKRQRRNQRGVTK